MGTFAADTSEVDRAAAQLYEAGHQLVELTDPNSEVGRVVVEAARPPRLSGNLGATSRADVTRNGVAWASTARYWTFVHWGAPRRHIRARPYFVEAVDRETDRIVAVYAAHVTDTIRRINP